MISKFKLLYQLKQEILEEKNRIEKQKKRCNYNTLLAKLFLEPKRVIKNKDLVNNTVKFNPLDVIVEIFREDITDPFCFKVLPYLNLNDINSLARALNIKIDKSDVQKLKDAWYLQLKLFAIATRIAMLLECIKSKNVDLELIEEILIFLQNYEKSDFEDRLQNFRQRQIWGCDANDGYLNKIIISRMDIIFNLLYEIKSFYAKKYDVLRNSQEELPEPETVMSDILEKCINPYSKMHNIILKQKNILSIAFLLSFLYFIKSYKYSWCILHKEERFYPQIIAESSKNIFSLFNKMNKYLLDSELGVYNQLFIYNFVAPIFIDTMKHLKDKECISSIGEVFDTDRLNECFEIHQNFNKNVKLFNELFCSKKYIEIMNKFYDSFSENEKSILTERNKHLTFERDDYQRLLSSCFFNNNDFFMVLMKHKRMNSHNLKMFAKLYKLKCSELKEKRNSTKKLMKTMDFVLDNKDLCDFHFSLNSDSSYFSLYELAGYSAPLLDKYKSKILYIQSHEDKEKLIEAMNKELEPNNKKSNSCDVMCQVPRDMLNLKGV